MKLLFSSIFIVVSFVGTCRAEFVIDFADDNNSLDGHVGGSSSVFTDDAGNGTATITTSTVAPNGSLNITNSGNQLGINSNLMNEDSDGFDLGESWTFSWNRDMFLNLIDIDRFNETEQVKISSAAWFNQSIDDSGSASVMFSNEMGQGVFTLSDLGTSDIFTINELNNGNLLPIVPAGTMIEFRYSNTGTSLSNTSAGIGQMNFSATPEPTSFLMFGSIAGMYWLRNRWRR